MVPFLHLLLWRKPRELVPNRYCAWFEVNIEKEARDGGGNDSVDHQSEAVISNQLTERVKPSAVEVTVPLRNLSLENLK